MCDHTCLLPVGHLERGELHYYGYIHPSPYDRIATLTAQLARYERALRAARDELDRWGYGDYHYGPTPRDPDVLQAIAQIDAALAAVQVSEEPDAL